MAGDENKKREWTDLDDLYGEQIASDFYRGVQEKTDHYEAAHHRGPLKAIGDFLMGNEPEECINPRCEAYEAEETSESWWERWLRGSGDGGEGSSGSSD